MTGIMCALFGSINSVYDILHCCFPFPCCGLLSITVLGIAGMLIDYMTLGCLMLPVVSVFSWGVLPGCVGLCGVLPGYIGILLESLMLPIRLIGGLPRIIGK